MKTLRRIVKLLPPAFIMRIWLERKYGIKVKPSPWGGMAGALLAVAPYLFTAALNERKDSDCRLFKYFLPYGRMKKFVRLAYGMKVGDDKSDSGAAGAIRYVMPYGLVLWWDAENAVQTGKRDSQEPGDALADQPARPERKLPEIAREEMARLDRIEALTLRLLILNGDAK